MDLDLVIRGIGSDVEAIIRAFGGVGYAIVLLGATLPVASLLAASRGNRLALVPALGSVSLIVAWVAYYATGWWHIDTDVLLPALGCVLAGWVVLGAALWWSRGEPAT